MSIRPAPCRRSSSLRGEGPARGHLWILLPAYEEAESLPPLLRDLAKTLAEWDDAPPTKVLVVDDGSTDGTAEAARQAEGLDIQVLVHEQNRGLGEAMKTGIEFVLAHGCIDDLLATMDADHTHPPELLPTMLGRIRQGADIVIASRYQPGAEVHGLDLFRKGISLAASGLLQVLFPGARDYTCGYRVYRVDTLHWAKAHYGEAFLNQEGFSVMVDLLLKLRRHVHRIDEVPLVLRYDRKRSTSKMNLIQTATSTLVLLQRRYRGDPR